MLEQLSTAKRSKTWAKFPCTSLFLTGSSFTPSCCSVGIYFACAHLSICFGLDSSVPGHTDCSVSPFSSPSATGTAFPAHDQVGPNQRYTSSILCFHMVSNYAGSSWKHNLKYNFGSISSEGISFSDCLLESELPFANSSSLFSWLLCPPLKVYHAC